MMNSRKLIDGYSGFIRIKLPHDVLKTKPTRWFEHQYFLTALI